MDFNQTLRTLLSWWVGNYDVYYMDPCMLKVEIVWSFLYWEIVHKPCFATDFLQKKKSHMECFLPTRFFFWIAPDSQTVKENSPM